MSSSGLLSLRQETSGEYPGERHKDVWRPGESLVVGKSERLGCVQPGEGKTEGGSYQCL